MGYTALYDEYKERILPIFFRRYQARLCYALIYLEPLLKEKMLCSVDIVAQGL